MLQYIMLLPLELQSKILDEIPFFVRLSKNKVVGRKYLESLYSKNISSDEFDKYIKICKPDKYYYYYKNDKVFTIFENYWYFGYYRKKFHNFYYDDNGIMIHVTDNWINDYNYDMTMIRYDLCTTYNIYKHLRKEYVDLDKIILNYFNENLLKYQTNNEFVNKMIQTNYIYSNKLNINDTKMLSVLTTRLSNMLNRMNKNDLKKDDILSYIDNNDILPEIYEYIKNLK